MRIERSADWPEKLATFVHDKSHQSFEWGVNDCALFAADWVKILTDKDPAEAFRGRYSTAREAVDIIQEQGGLEAIATKALGEPLSHTLMIQRGDVALVQVNGRESLTICVGSEVVGPAVDTGVALVPITDIIKSWAV